MSTMRRSKLIFQESFGFDFDFQNSILIYDQVLEKKHKIWITQFQRRYKVRSGEGLKESAGLPAHLRKIHQLAQGISKQDLKIVAMGGGSVGDFTGFIASIYKRGVQFVQIPTTWLSAIDSAHGGKTALNLAGAKNQVGTFYPASSIYLVKEIFTDLPPARVIEVLGEYYKIGLIQGGTLWKKMSAHPVLDSNFLWKLLPQMISAKMKVVVKDPFEQKGLRHILNLGHTVGHVLEAALKLPHGEAVLYGLRFAYEFGLRTKRTQNIKEFEWMLPSIADLRLQLKKVRNPESFLQVDKKSIGRGQLIFVFIKAPGKVSPQRVALQGILQEWKRQSK